MTHFRWWRESLARTTLTEPTRLLRSLTYVSRSTRPMRSKRATAQILLRTPRTLRLPIVYFSTRRIFAFMQAPSLYPLRFEPIYQYRLWGGRRLASLLSASFPDD